MRRKSSWKPNMIVKRLHMPKKIAVGSNDKIKFPGVQQASNDHEEVKRIGGACQVYTSKFPSIYTSKSPMVKQPLIKRTFFKTSVCLQNYWMHITLIKSALIQV